ncbi:hypothetical protein LXL04_030964 [Taraxacum kok-saghyz]
MAYRRKKTVDKEDFFSFSSLVTSTATHSAATGGGGLCEGSSRKGEVQLHRTIAREVTKNVPAAVKDARKEETGCYLTSTSPNHRE